MNQITKCAHPACLCIVTKGGPYKKFCSEHCKEAAGEIELRCDCQHTVCRVGSAPTHDVREQLQADPEPA